MKRKTLLLITIGILTSTILVAQLEPQVISAGKPTIIPVPTKSYTLILKNIDNSATGGKTLHMSPPVKTTFVPEHNVAGLTFFTNYNTDQGLALSSIACGYKDKSGNLWFGTLGGGVSRFDGKAFTNFTTTQGLANNIVYSITEDKMGNIWFGTSGGGVSRYDGKSFTTFTTAQGLGNNTVWNITEDKTGNLWFATGGGGVSRYNGKSFSNFTTADGLANNTIRSIKEDKSGNLWFATGGGGVSRFDGKFFTNFTTAKGLANDTVSCIALDLSGNLWFGTLGGGVSRFNGKSFANFTTGQGLANNVVYSIEEDKTGNIWYGTDGGGVSRFDGKSFTNFTTKQGLANNTVWSITQDKTGNLWFGTFGGGVSRYVGNSVIDFTTAHALANNIVYSIMEDKKGNLWFGTLGGGVTRFDGKTFTNFTMEQGLANNTIRCITEDKKGNLWFATDGGGISLFDGKSFSNFTTVQGLPNNTVWAITEDKSGNLWIGTDGGGVSRFDGKTFTNYSTSHGLANNNIWSILQDKTGNLWFATYGGGVSRYDGKSFTNFTTAQGLANNNVWNITEDNFGNLWFGTFGGGVSRYDGKSFINFTTAQGLADDVVYDIVIDSQNNIFIGTNMGFSVLKGFKRPSSPEQYPRKVGTNDADSAFRTESGDLSKREILPAVNSLSNKEIKKYQVVFEFYNKKTGYPIKDLNFNAMFVDSKGIIWGGCGDNKLIRFDYNAILKSREPPTVFIQAIKIQEQNVSWYNLIKNWEKKYTNAAVDSLAILNEEIMIFGKKLSLAERDSLHHKYSGIKFDSISRFYSLPENLQLPHNLNSITFDFVAIEPAKHFLVRYQYILEGYDKEWSPITDKTSATFGNIYEGRYTFKLKARSPDGVWSEPITYTFKVLPPWYRAWWAYTMYAIIFVLVGLGIMRWRTSRLHAQAIKMKKKIEEATEEIRQQKDAIEKEKEISEQKSVELENTLQNLKTTQQQLFQREKMASLGELTAGIAHEIQNPLNFVNNFSEVNAELIDEMEKEFREGNKEEGITIISNIKQNLEKVIHHGKRADSIVKGMLQHSRVSTGQKEPTDINALADEYLRLSYHGFRSKDKSFNVTIQTDFDKRIDKILVVSQDIGRVLLNLINNAFYSVTEKNKIQMDARLPGRQGYEPIVSISTKEFHSPTAGGVEGIEIKIKDNGLGIPQKILDKIFQPFFTTKATGHGTGLGLSLSYDIITKEHHGELKVETKEGEFAEFIILLPLS